MSVLEDDSKFGYAYEYLQTVSSYTGWTYEYKYGTWNELYQWLLDGEIDLLTDVAYSEERAKYMLFPDYKMGTENYYLYSNTLNTTEILTDIDSLNSYSIGIDTGTYQYGLFKNWAKNKKLKSKIIEYNNEKDSYQTFENGDIDLYLSMDIVAEFFWEPVAKVGDSDFYIAVTKSRTDILEELNNVLNQIYMIEPYYNNSLWQKYFSDITTSKQLTDSEQNWLNKHNRTIRFGYINDDLPFATKNKDGECEGLLSDMVGCLKNSFSIDTVDIQFICYKNYAGMTEALNKGDIDAMFPVINDPDYAENNGTILTIPVTTVPMGYIAYKDLTHLDIKKVVIYPDSRTKFFVDSYYPAYEQVLEYSAESCFEAVNQHKADAAFFNMYKIQNVLNGAKRYNNISAVTIPASIEVGFALLRENYNLCTIINKAVASIPDAEINECIENHLNERNKISVSQIIQNYLPLMILICLVILFLVLSLFVTIDKLMEYINYDPLTHLLNRRRLDSYIKKSIKDANENDKNFSIILFDLDNFKKINDKYGHDCGDVVLKAISSVIQTNIKDCDYAFRWGGEEFMIILSGNLLTAKKTAERIRSAVEALHVSYDNVFIPITVTAGCVEYEKGSEYKQMFLDVDEKLYRGKTNGKNVVIG